MKTDIESIRLALKEALKLQKMNYSSLAKKMKISESGLKKILNGKDLSLSRLIQISEILKIGIDDIIENSFQLPSARKCLSKEQQELFENDLPLYDFYMAIAIYGLKDQKTLSELSKKYSLSKNSLNQYIEILKENDLIEVKNNKVQATKGGALYINSQLLGDHYRETFINNITKDILKNRSLYNHKDSFSLYGVIKIRKDTYQDLLKAKYDLHREFSKRIIRENKVSNSKDFIEVAELDFLFPYSSAKAFPVPEFEED